ncbi:MAG: bifunctional methylenetetrahydrofolate dehydrogenase/methenyltetrahydrofolate cyclohydrolase FolD [Lentisphaeria bacterium]|nr:bifunctional methylenetetrahydrofolate dehydrogenase/methenyltetrahydrofolate cyclohydrolase FolD [Lentisphaeria bacterium]
MPPVKEEFVAKLIDGKAIAAEINRENAAEAAAIAKEYGASPGLAVVLVGNDPASQVYVASKVKKCAELGLYSEKIVLPENATQQEVLDVVRSLNGNPAIHGILVQSPPPPQIDEQAVINAIDPAKDVDCFHPFNVGKLLLGDLSGLLPCTPWGIIQLLERSGISPSGKHAVVLGRSNIVGKPMAALLMAKGKNADATVTVCHSRTRNLGEITRTADILIAAVGKPGFVKGDMVKEGAVVIDVGINRISDPSAPKGTRLVGDVDFDSVAPKAARITPVPGGVGPMTIAVLMRNTICAFKAAMKKK